MGLRKKRRVHFVGIGGSGMSGIAEILLNLGHDVQGSDLVRSEAVERLESLGAKVRLGHAAENVGDAEVLVISSAVGEDNPEVIAARARKIPVIPRAEMLAELMGMKESIAVAGAHGKTTASTLLATILAEAGMDPTVIIGGRVKQFGSGARHGSGDFLVAEADESDGSFLTLNPTIAVVTSLDAEHINHYGSMEKIEEAFLRFCNSVPFFGAAVVCGDDPLLRAFGPKMNKKFITYGFTPDCDLVASDYSCEGMTGSFTVSNKDGELGRVELHLPGRHNALNALSAIQVALMLDVDFKTAASAIGKFSGIARRSEIKGEIKGVTVIDDYGHHPNEIRACIKSIKEGMKGRRLVTLFQPHRYTRTRDSLKDFFTAFVGSDLVGLLPIYAASEKPIEGVSSLLIYDGVRASGQENVFSFESKEQAGSWLKETLKKDDVLLTLGAGDVYRVGEKYLSNGNS